MKKKEEDFETLIEYCYYVEEDGMLWLLSKDMYNDYTNSDEYKEGEYFWYIDRYFHKDTNETFLAFYDGIHSLDEDGVYIGEGVSLGPWA